MSQTDIKDEVNAAPEPLLPIEKKLIGWSLGLGVALLVVDVQWVEFQFGPPLLEAINVGSVDFGYVGDAPPIFAQAANARIRYAAAVKQGGGTQAIVVRKEAPIKSLADLKGKRIAFG